MGNDKRVCDGGAMNTLTVPEAIDYLWKSGKTKRRVNPQTFYRWVRDGRVAPVDGTKPYRFDVRALNRLQTPTPGARKGRPIKPLKNGERLTNDGLVRRIEACSW
jgi:hypothetical protein